MAAAITDVLMKMEGNVIDSIRILGIGLDLACNEASCARVTPLEPRAHAHSSSIPRRLPRIRILVPRAYDLLLSDWIVCGGSVDENGEYEYVLLETSFPPFNIVAILCKCAWCPQADARLFSKFVNLTSL